MKNIRKTFLLLLAIAVLCACFTVGAGATEVFEDGGFAYTVTDGEATIVGGPRGDVVIPDTIGGYKVTKIGRQAFCLNTGLKSIIISDSVEVIEEEAFLYCENLEKVVIGNGVKHIEEDAFQNTFIKDLTLGNSIETIGNNAFYVFQCDELILPDTLKSIGDNAFEAGEGYETLIIPDSVETIGERAFSSCDTLKKVVIGKNVKNFGYGIFESCENLEEVIFKDGITTIGESMLWGCSSIKNITIPDSVETIGEGAFGYCDTLNKVKLGNNVTKIVGFAFFGCDIKEIRIPKSVKIIDVYAFGSVEVVYYYGSEEEWASIDLYGNDDLKTATIHFNCTDHDHSFEEEILDAPTCRKEGYGKYLCSCGEYYREAIASVTHSMTEWATDYPATCYSAGREIRYCKYNCGYSETRDTEQLTHSMSVWRTDYASTCTANGRESRYCTHNCGYTEQNTLPLAKHKMSGWTVDYPATCTESGLKYNKCSACGYTEYEAIDAIGHKDADSDGFCDNCGTELKTEDCSCNCHKGGFMGFVWKIVRFFQKIFGMNEYCACGAAHW